MNEMYIGAGLAIGLSGIGIGIGEGIIAKKSVELMGRNPAMISFFLTVTVLGIALAESSAIYGLIVAQKILGTEGLSLIQSAGAGLAVGLAGLGAAIGEGFLIAGSLEAMNRNPENKQKMLTFMVLFVALVESAAIYGLIVAMQILG
ncbi:MAG: ATP synthase F0 subunit C [Candidatus Gracilibacteria bacterium]|nr:ATP synthase F0 subunit C [Candidatus Gracilibacteria bacterium]